MGLLREKVKHYDLTWGASSRRAAICRGTAAWLAGRLAKADTLAFSKGCRMNSFTKALSELQQATQALDLATVAAITDLIAEAGRIVLHSAGRERVQLMAFAMRLHQLGLRVAMHGDMAEPPVGPGDILICSAGGGDYASVGMLLHLAGEAGADTVLLTTPLGGLAEGQATQRLAIPVGPVDAERKGQGETAQALAMGSLYEGVLFLIFEVMALDLRKKLGVLPETMLARRSNLE